jgi:5'-3' exonuclease
VVAPYEADA